MITGPNRLDVVEAVRNIRHGILSCERLVQACLDRIETRDPEVRALVSFNPDLALATARQWDKEPDGRAPLRGIPFLAKDVLDTAEFPTSYGSSIYSRHQPVLDAASVCSLKQKGAILVGKAATSEFATRQPAATRNPLRLSHTPGGSSSGSAAAVADFMVPFALGSQSTGSICRPASYCGIVGYKPSFDLFSRAGLKMTSQSQDTIGLLTRSVRDAAYIAFNCIDSSEQTAHLSAPHYAICISSQWAYADTHFNAAIDQLSQTLLDQGHRVSRFPLPPAFEDLIDIQSAIFSYELAEALGNEYIGHADALSQQLIERIRRGQRISTREYLGLRQTAEHTKRQMDLLFQDADVLLYPATESSAEDGIGYSGSPRFGAIWTLLHLPTVIIPFAHTDNGMPFGLQLIGRFGDDQRVLAYAEALASQIQTLPQAAT